MGRKQQQHPVAILGIVAGAAGSIVEKDRPGLDHNRPHIASGGRGAMLDEASGG